MLMPANVFVVDHGDAALSPQPLAQIVGVSFVVEHLIRRRQRPEKRLNHPNIGNVFTGQKHV